MAFKCADWVAEKLARNWILGVNVLFFLFAIILMIMAVGAITQVAQVTENVVILQFFDLTLMAWCIFLMGLMTLITSVLGFYGAYSWKVTPIKVYTFILFMVICLELGVGIYIFQLDVDSLESFWFTDTDVGYDRRESYQGYFDCCGWNTITDSYPYPGGGLGPECHDFGIALTCRQASVNWMDEYILPISTAIIIVPMIEFISLIGAFFIMATAGQQSNGRDFDFHY